MIKKYAIILVILSGCLWGTIGIFVRQFSSYGFSSMDIVGIRSVITSIILFISLVIYKPSLLKVKLKDLWCFIGSGIFSMLFFNYCYFKTILLTSLSIAAILLYTAPIFVMILSLVIFNEKITSKKLICLILVLMGCSLVCGILGGNNNLTVAGVIIGLGSGIGYALYSIFCRFALKRDYSPITITAYTFLFSSIGCVFFVNFPSLTYSLLSDGTNTIELFLFYTIVTSILPYILYTTGLQYIENTKASVIVSIEPVVATILGVIIFKETLTLSMFFGIILVISALTLLNVPYEFKKVHHFIAGDR